MTLEIGDNVDNIDAGFEDPGNGSLSGRFFEDTDDDNQDNGNGSEPGVENVLVMLLDGTGAPTGQTARTDANGNYAFLGLAAGVYGVKFTDPDGVLDGKMLVDANVGDDASDSDAIGDVVESVIENIVVSIGENTPDNDAGVEEIPNTPPMADDEMAEVCADTTLTIDLSDNGTDADGDAVTVTQIMDEDETVGVGGTITLESGATATLNADGTVTFDGIAAFDDLLINDTAMESFGFTVSDGRDTATGQVDVTIKGALNTLETIDDSLEDAVITFRLEPVASFAEFEDAYTLTVLGSSDPDIPTISFTQAYCIDSTQPIDLGVLTTAEISVANEENAAAAGVVNADKIDSVNWLLNNDQTLLDNGDGTGDTYTDLEVQEAIWLLLNNDTFFLNSPDFAGIDEVTDNENGVRDGVEIATIENAMEIAMLAMTAGDGFEAGAGDIVGLIVDPTDPEEQEQPFIIGVEFDTLADDCIC